RAAVAAGFTIGASTDGSLDRKLLQLVIPGLAWRTASSFWPPRIVAVRVFSLTVTSYPTPGPVDGLGLGAEAPMPAAPQAQRQRPKTITANTTLISRRNVAGPIRVTHLWR